jgi:predicted DNA binding CopG/RHH family protein
MKKLVVPKFETEAEEADWWDQHMDIVGDNLIEAMENGTAHRGGPAALLRETRVMNVRMNNSDLERIEKLAEEKGISDQACMNMLLRDALDREDANRQTPAA